MKAMFYNCIVIISFTTFAIVDVSAGTGMACATETSFFNYPESSHCSADMFCCETKDGGFYCCDASDYFAKNGMKTVFSILIAAVVGCLLVCCLCCLCCPCCMLYKRRHQGTVYGNISQPGVQTTIVTVPQQPYPVQHNIAPSTIQHGQPMPQHVMSMPQAGMPIPQHVMSTPQAGMPMPQAGMPMPQPGMPIPQHGMPMQQPGMPQHQYQGGYPVFPSHAAAQLPPTYNEAVAQEAYSKQAPFNPNF